MRCLDSRVLQMSRSFCVQQSLDVQTFDVGHPDYGHLVAALADGGFCLHGNVAVTILCGKDAVDFEDASFHHINVLPLLGPLNNVRVPLHPKFRPKFLLSEAKKCAESAPKIFMMFADTRPPASWHTCAAVHTRANPRPTSQLLRILRGDV